MLCGHFMFSYPFKGWEIIFKEGEMENSCWLLCNFHELFSITCIFPFLNINPQLLIWLVFNQMALDNKSSGVVPIKYLGKWIQSKFSLSFISHDTFYCENCEWITMLVSLLIKCNNNNNKTALKTQLIGRTQELWLGRRFLYIINSIGCHYLTEILTILFHFLYFF